MNTPLTIPLNNRYQLADKIYFFGLILLAVGLPLSMFLMSVSQFVLLGSWLIGGGYGAKAKRFFTDKVCLSLIAVYAIHLIGLLYTTDFKYAANDLRIKVPLLILPFIFFTSTQLTKKQFIIILKLFVLACLAGTLVSTAVWLDIIHRHVTDRRNISIFISHIRFSLLICISMFACGYFIFKTDKTLSAKIVHTALITWFIIFLFILESMTGLIIGGIALAVLLIQELMRRKKYLLLAGCVMILLGGFFITYNYINNQLKELRKEDMVDISNLPKLTAHGNHYQHELFKGDVENGHRIFLYVCYDELQIEWNKRSKISYDSLDERKQWIKYTLIRYMTSKGLHKDADGMALLNDSDIRNIEQGIGSINEFTKTGLKGRIYDTIWEINNYLIGGDPSGHTLSMRFEFWQASIAIIKEHLFFGVGTGDNQRELNQYYESKHSRLLKQWWLRSHNQFLAIGVSFGLIGLLIFMFSLFYPIIKLRMYNDYLYFTFFVIAMLSFFTEDTLETQAGVTFYAFFNCFFLFVRNKNEN